EFGRARRRPQTLRSFTRDARSFPGLPVETILRLRTGPGDRTRYPGGLIKSDCQEVLHSNQNIQLFELLLQPNLKTFQIPKELEVSLNPEMHDTKHHDAILKKPISRFP